METEIWKPIVGFDNYEISNLGNVMSLSYRKTNKKTLLKQTIKNGYWIVSLSTNGKNYKEAVHRLICNAFIENIENKPCVNHKNGVRTDNRIENLEWCTYAENNLHAYRVLNKKPPMSGKLDDKNNLSKAVYQFNEQGNFINRFNSISGAGRLTNINNRRINDCCNGKQKTAGGFKWKFAEK